MSFGPRRAKVLGYLSVQFVSEISNVCDPDPPTSQTDGQTDGRTTCDGNTALCTIVHRAVKIKNQIQKLLQTLKAKLRELLQFLHKTKLKSGADP